MESLKWKLSVPVEVETVQSTVYSKGVNGRLRPETIFQHPTTTRQKELKASFPLERSLFSGSQRNPSGVRGSMPSLRVHLAKQEVFRIPAFTPSMLPQDRHEVNESTSARKQTCRSIRHVRTDYSLDGSSGNIGELATDIRNRERRRRNRAWSSSQFQEALEPKWLSLESWR